MANVTEALDDSVPERETGQLVSSVQISGLHGLYNYKLSLDSQEGVARLALLYGDNGSGKTTILRLLWDLLSPSNTGEHRKNIAGVAFSRLAVSLGDTYTIVAERALPVAGPYTIEVRKRGRLSSKSEWPEKGRYDEYFEGWDIKQFKSLKSTSGDPEVLESGNRVLEKKKYIGFLESLGSAPYFLADDRSTASDEFSRDVSDRERARAPRYNLGSIGEDTSKTTSRRLAKELEISMKRANLMLQQLALGGAASGSAGADYVYLDVLKQLGAPAATVASNPQNVRAAISEDIAALAERSSSFERLGLIPKFVGADFAREVGSLDDSRVDVAVSVLRPYLESLSARLDGLSEAHDLISTFLNEANTFLKGKSLTYSARNAGLRIHLASGEPLRPEQLSSGECHIILLLCNAILAREGSKLFLIDEPELSLNVKWQRRVVAALLACTTGSNVQFVIATHSIELLSGFRTNVVRMTDEAIDS